MSNETNAILNQVIVLLNRSLAAYLADAVPWMGRAGAEVGESLTAMVKDQQQSADRLAEFVLDNGGDVAAGEFPMSFTALHDLSIEFCLKKLLQTQQEAVQYLQQAVAALERAPMAKALVEETLGSARGHLETLNELLTAVH